MGYEIWDTEREELLGFHPDLQVALAFAEHLACDLITSVEEQLAANGEGHPGGIAVSVAVHETGTGLQLAGCIYRTAAVPAAAGGTR